MASCTFCSTALDEYDPVVLTRDHGAERKEVGRFCTFACLREYIDEEGLVYGESCRC